jgi:LuxR family transcriptional regulator, maltose regulon positive regulatory protein
MNAESQPGISPAIDKLNSWKRYRLVLLVAPPGSGKSALLRKWAKEVDGSARANPDETEPVRAAWIDLGPEDNDPDRFLADLVAALDVPGLEVAGLDGKGWRVEGLEGDAGHSTPPVLPATEVHLRFESEMTRLANALTGVQGELILVLDHYHHILASVIHSAVAQLLDYPPPQVHLVIASRDEPPLPLPRLRARRQMVDIFPVDFRMI